MPDLNLIDDNEMEESSSLSEQPAPKKSGGGVSISTHLIILLILTAVLGGGYFMWKKGIFPFKKKTAQVVSQAQDEFPQDQYQQQNADEQNMPPPTDSSDVALLENPLPDEGQQPVMTENAAPVDQPAEQPKETKAVEQPKKSTAKKAEASEPAPLTTPEGTQKLSDMQGEFTVQIVTYKEKKTAGDMAKHLSDNSGYPAFVQKARMKGGDWWSVCIGKYASKQEAAKAVPSFGEQLRANHVIVRISSK